MAKKKDDAEKLYHESLDLLDQLHTCFVDFAELCDVDADRGPLVTDDGERLPRSQFVVDGDDEVERGGIAIDTRTTLCLSHEQAESLVFSLVRALRDGEDEVAIDLDGRFMLKGSAARDVRRTLDEA